jgi:hypothetical protein
MTKYATALLFACSLYSQSDSIYINGIELKVGMPKSDVLTLLAERNDLVKIQGINDAWCVKPKGDHITPGCGDNFIQFSQDKVSVVNRNMGTSNGNGAAAMIANLFSTLDGLARSGKTALAFSTQEFESGDHVRFRILSFITGSKKYTFITRQPVGSQSATTSTVELEESFILPSDQNK